MGEKQAAVMGRNIVVNQRGETSWSVMGEKQAGQSSRRNKLLCQGGREHWSVKGGGQADQSWVEKQGGKTRREKQAGQSRG